MMALSIFFLLLCLHEFFVEGEIVDVDHLIIIDLVVDTVKGYSFDLVFGI